MLHLLVLVITDVMMPVEDSEPLATFYVGH